MDAEMFLFPDTHFFLHFKHAQELPWADVTQSDPITLVVGLTVQKEIEKHKFELRGRPQDRARTYSKKLAEIVAAGQPTLLRAAKPQVLLDFNIEREVNWILPAGLDPLWGDDLLISDVLAFAQLNPTLNVAILTGDPGLIAKAKRYRITVVSLAGRGWELAVEKTPEEKELEKLRREHEELKRAGPLIGCALEIEQTPNQNIDLRIGRCPALTDQLVDELLDGVMSRHPRVTDFSVSSEFEPPPQEQIETYLKNYDAWHADMRDFLRRVPAMLDETASEVDVSLIFVNEGNEPASGVRLTIEALGGFFLSEIKAVEDRDGEEKSQQSRPSKPSKFRPPPSPPRPKRIVKIVPQLPAFGASPLIAKQIADHQRAAKILGSWNSLGEIERVAQAVRHHDLLREAVASSCFPNRARATSDISIRPFDPARLIPKPRDRHAFYWYDTPARSMVERWDFECEEFQHRMDPEIFKVRITGTFDGKPTRRGGIRIRLFARNMRSPFEAVFPIHFTVTEFDLTETLNALLP